MTGPEQLTLALAHRPAQGRDDFLVSTSNEAAFRAVAEGALGPRLALSGPEGSGKTHLASIWGERTLAVTIAARDLTESRMGQILGAPAVVIEDIDRIAEMPASARRQVEALLFHTCNLTQAEATPLMLTCRGAPARWQVETPDLASRLAAFVHIAIQEPDDHLLAEILTKLFSDRQLVAGKGVVPYLLIHMERSFAAAEAVVAELDRKALAERRAITRHLATQLFVEPEDPQTGAP